MKLILAVMLVAVASQVNSFILFGPLHASCKIKYSWPNTDCSVPLNALLAQIDAWKSDENCKNGGEKCLYTLKSSTSTSISATHATPVKKYIDDLTFTFTQSSTTCNCDVSFFFSLLDCWLKSVTCFFFFSFENIVKKQKIYIFLRYML